MSTKEMTQAGPGGVIVKHESSQHQQSGLSPLVQAAMGGNISTEQMREVLAIQKEYEANEARKAYNLALAEFKRSPVDVFNDKVNKQFDSTYSSKGNLINTVNAAMGPYGLSARFDFKQEGDTIAVTCILSHAMGHSESVSLSAPPDKSGAKNPIQQIKSTITYLQIATYEAITGTASQAGSMDDDGNLVGQAPVETISEEQLASLRDTLGAAGKDEALFVGYLKKSGANINALEQLPAGDWFDFAVKTLSPRVKA